MGRGKEEDGEKMVDMLGIVDYKGVVSVECSFYFTLRRLYYLRNRSLSLLNSTCYSDIHMFSTQATSWGCEHEKDALVAYITLEWHQPMKALTVSKCFL